MNRLWIFGDSFSAPYDTEVAGTNIVNEYIKKEKEDGTKQIKDINYWFEKYLPENVALENLAKPGLSNDSILDKFFHSYSLIQPGDYVILQVVPVDRFRVSHFNGEIWYEVQPPINEEQSKHINELTGWDLNTINQVGKERNSRAYIASFNNRLNFIKSICSSKKIRVAITSSDLNLRNICSIPEIYNSPESTTIVDKYPLLRDWHPSYEGWRYIVNEYLEFFDLNE